jgi:hypothetical protein
MAGGGSVRLATRTSLNCDTTVTPGCVTPLVPLVAAHTRHTCITIAE